MALTTAVRLTGEDLKIDDVWAVAVDRAPAELETEARDKVARARALVERAAHGTTEHTYGVNTGFGKFVSRSIPEELTAELQLRLLRSHAAGVGDPAPLAHLALPLVGEGEARVDGRRMSGADALAEVGLVPISLEAKEGLS